MDIIEQMEKDERAMERIAASLEHISKSLATWLILAQARFEKEYPLKREVRDADITRVPSERDKLLESLGASNEPLEDWVGLREQELLDKSSESATPIRTKGKRP